jgi:hypothetical protein
MKPIRQPQPNSRSVNPEPSYPLQIDAEYVVRRGRRVVEQGGGRVVSMGQHELILDSAQPIASGLRIECNLPWPGPELALVLRLKGRTVSSHGNRTSVWIAHYQFQSVKKAQPAPQGAEKVSGGAGSPRTAPLAS